MLGVLITLIVLIFFYGIFFTAFYISSARHPFIQHISRRELSFYFLIAIVFLCLIVAIMVREKFVYYWDFGGYWYKTLDYANLLFSDPIAAIKSLYWSINNEEYNSFLCLLLALPLKIFGNSYMAFVVLNTVMFYIPNAFLMGYLVYSITVRYQIKAPGFGWIFTYMLAFPVALHPVLLGYIDIANMLPLSAAYLLMIDRDFQKREFLKDFLLGLCIMLVVLSRRYYAYAVVGAAFFCALYWLMDGIREFEGDFRIRFTKNIKMRLGDAVFTLVFPCLILVLLFHDFLNMSIFNNHAVAYSAYKSVDYLGQWVKLIEWVGLFHIILVACAFLFNLKRKFNLLVISFLVNLFITCTLFYRIQDMGAQHYYTITLILAVLSGVGGVSLVNWLHNKTKIVSCVVACGLLLCVGINFLGSVRIVKDLASPFWTKAIYWYRVRYDLNELDRMENYLGELDAAGYKNVYCLGSSGIINDDLLRKIHAPELNLLYSCMQASHIDLRDGFNTNFFDADVVLSCDPEQTHLTSGQELIRLENRIFSDENPFSDNYRSTETFLLDNNVKVTVWIKEEPLAYEDIMYFGNLCDELYPDYPELFKDRIDNYLQQHDLKG